MHDKCGNEINIGEKVIYSKTTWMVESHNGHMCLHNNGNRIFMDDSIASQSKKVVIDDFIK